MLLILTLTLCLRLLLLLLQLMILQHTHTRCAGITGCLQSHTTTDTTCLNDFHTRHTSSSPTAMGNTNTSSSPPTASPNGLQRGGRLRVCVRVRSR